MSKSRSAAATLWRTLLIVALIGTVHAQSTPDKTNSVFEGAVRDSATKLPIPKASVHLIPSAANQPGYAGISDATGRFRFDAIVPGEYRTQTRGRGYAEGQSVAVDAKSSTATVHFTAGNDVVNAVIELDPEAIITGRVTDADGEPVPAAVVFAITEQWQRGFRIYKPVESTQADVRGEYRLRVLPGRYYISALPLFDGIVPQVFAEDPGKPEMRAAVTVYPNASTIEAGALLDLRPGQQLSGIVFKLRNSATYHVRGTVKLATPPAPRTTVMLMRRNRDSSPGASAGSDVRKDGTFDLKGVAPGNYWLELIPQRASTTGRMPVDVTDRDVNGIRMPSIPPFDIKGRVRFDQDGVDLPFSAVKLHIDWLDWFLFTFASVATPGADGAFVFPLRPAGVYAITLLPDRDLYIQSVSYNQRAVEAGRIDFSDGPTGEVEVVLATGTGQVEGSVHWPDSVPGAAPPPLPPGASAILVCASGVTGNTGARSASIDQAGHFQFPFVPPGRYFAFVSPRFDEGMWQNMDFVQEIRERGVSVDVAAKGSASVEAPILSAGDIQRAVEKVPR